MSVEKHYPTDSRGELDAGAVRSRRPPRLCCARVTHTDGRVGWCRELADHDGAHHATLSAPIPPHSFMPKGAK